MIETMLTLMVVFDVALKRFLFGKVEIGLIKQAWSNPWFRVDVAVLVLLVLLTLLVILLKASPVSEELDLFILLLRCIFQIARIGAYLFK